MKKIFSGAYAITTTADDSLLLFNDSGGSIDFGERDVNINSGFGFTADGGINSGNLIANGKIALTKRFVGAQGANVASASSITLGDGNYFYLTGTTKVNNIDVTAWNSGSEVTVKIIGGLTLGDKSGGSGQLELAGSIDYPAPIGALITFILDGTIWNEKCRSED